MANKPRSLRETNKLVSMREGAHLSQQEIAEKLGISVSTYSRLEKRPERMRTDRAIVLAKLFGVEVSEIQEGDYEGHQMAATGRAVPVHRIAAGKLEDTGKHQIYVFDLPGSAITVIVPDASMEPACCEGDLILINPEIEPTPGRTVLANSPVTDEAVLRSYAPLHPTDERAPGFILRAVNSSYPEITATADRPGQIVGVATHRTHEMH